MNAGSGRHYLHGWVNADIDPGCGADICTDLTGIPLPDGSAEKVFASHLLEHLEYRKQLPAVLAEFRRVLAPGGHLCVVGPDIERAVLLGEPPTVLQAIVAWPDTFNIGRWAQKTPPAGHAWTATGSLVEAVLENAGFVWTAYTGRLAELATAGWPLDNLALWQNGYVCEAAG